MNIKFNYIAISLIALVSVISYINIFQNEFVWDDHVFILDNPDVRSLSNAPSFFAKDMEGLYRPVRSIYYALIYSFAGKNEFWYHFSSIVFHALISILVFLIINGMFNNKNTSLVSALIFASHPIHTERVANITGGFDLLGVFFMLLSFYLYIKFSKNNDKKYFLLSLILFLIAVFSSEEALMMPLLIIVYEFCFDREELSKQSIKNKIVKIYGPYFAIALFYAAIRFFALGIKGRAEEYLAGSFYLTMLTMLKAYAYYIYLLIFPVNLTVYHEIRAAASLLELKVIISALILLAIVFFAVKNYKNKILLFSVFWFFITLLPFSNMLPLQTFVAERYLYVPSTGFSLLVSHFLFQIYNFNLKNKKILQYSVIAFITVLLGFYAAKTNERNEDWKDDLTLWSKSVKMSPVSSRAHDNLGFTYDRIGRTKEALEEFKLAVKLQPDNFRALANLGTAYAKLGLHNESLAALKSSIEIKKDHKAYDKLGLVYAQLNIDEEAVNQFKESIRINPMYAKAHNDLATVYGKIGKFDLALQHFNEAIRIDKDYADAHYNLGVLLEFLGEKEKAIEEFRAAARLEPENGLYAKKI